MKDNSDKKHEISIYDKYQAKKISYKQPTPEDNLHEPTVTSIRNAWDKSAILEERGYVWVSTDCLHTILRTTPGNARHITGKISEKYKIERNETKYIKGSRLYMLIDELLQKAGRIKTEKYLRLSEEFYRSIRDANLTRRLRAEFYEFIRDVRRKLKRERIEKYNIKIDELTGESLNKRSSEFSHIRSVSIYPEFAGSVENGFIVNKNIHDIITANNINDENELVNFCAKQGWQTNWYENYIDYFNF